MPFLIFVYLLIFAGLGWNAVAAPAPREPLIWDAPDQTNDANGLDISSRFTFKVRNVSTNEVIIDDVKPSCGCTIAQLPSKPWHLAPQEAGQLEVLVDLRGKHGRLYKGIAILSSNAPKNLMVTVNIPERKESPGTAMENRMWGQQMAALDHQTVFKGDCVKCHLLPAFGKSGQPLYNVACGICHEAKRRATMVPDLHALKTEIDSDYWKNWITYGKAGTLMPGFTATEGGPLDDAQIDSLVDYLTKVFPRPLKPAPKTDRDDADD